jgi:hemerythrin-like domain-containing protein
MSQPLSPAALHGAPAPTFEQPFEMMQACHERLERMLVLLDKLQAHLPAHGADLQAQQAARDVMRYFDQAAPQHHRDEELHVFPPLLAQGEPRTVAVVQRLQEEHRRMEAQWIAARAILARIADGTLHQLAAGERQALADFAGLYAAHIEAEEDTAYARARGLFDAEGLAAMGREMMERRGVR